VSFDTFMISQTDHGKYKSVGDKLVREGASLFHCATRPLTVV